LVWIAALVCLGAPSLSAEVVERTRAVLVEIPVSVTLNDEPLRGLTVEDFELYDRGKRRRIAGFERLDLTLTAAGELTAPPQQISIAARRHFLVLFDLSFSEPRAIARARGVVEDWIESSLHPWDLIGVATYSIRGGASLLLNFTSDREQALLAVKTLGLPEYLDRGDDPLALEVGSATDRFGFLEDDQRADPGGGSRYLAGTDQARAALQQMYYSVYDPINRAGRRHQVSEFTRSLTDLIGVVQNARGRKHVVLLSEGFDGSLVFASAGRNDVERLAAAREHGQYWTMESSRVFGNPRTQSGLSRMVEAFRRADCSIEAMDIGIPDDASGDRGLASDRMDSLFYLANETGGELYRAFYNVDDSIADLMSKTSVTYLLTYQPENIKEDGKFHKLKVKLKGGPKGAELSHRAGFFAPVPFDQKRPADLQMDAASRIMEGRSGGDLSTSVLASAFQAAEADAYVPVLIEVDGASLPLERPNGSLPMEIYAYAIRTDGSIGDFFTQRLEIDLGTFGPRLRASGLKFFGDLRLAPGSYSIRVLVREGGSGLHGAEIVGLDIPEPDREQPVVLPPFFPEPQGKWLLSRETPDESRPTVPFPFRLDGKAYLPAAHPVIEAGVSSRVNVVTYNLGEGPISVRANVVARSGSAAIEPRIDVWEREAGEQNQDVFLASLDPEGLAVGEYVLTVAVSNERTGFSESNSIPFSVVERVRVSDSRR